MTIELVKPTDTKFFDSPDTGDQTCLCSRCGLPIAENEMALRAFVQGENAEYRYHEACSGIIEPIEDEDVDWNGDTLEEGEPF